jgi:hypothetical protein
MVMSSPVAGAEMITFLTVPRLCLAAFDHDLRAHRRPVDFRRVFGFEDAKALAVDSDGILGVRHGLVQVAEDGIVLQQMGKSLRVSDVIDGHDFDVRMPQRGAHDVPPDAPETVDSHFDRHESSGKTNAQLQLNSHQVHRDAHKTTETAFQFSVIFDARSRAMCGE